MSVHIVGILLYRHLEYSYFLHIRLDCVALIVMKNPIVWKLRSNISWGMKKRLSFEAIFFG